MSSIGIISVEDFLRNYDKQCEYIDGVLREKSLPTRLHSIIQLLMVLSLRRQGLEAFQELSVRPTSTRLLVPDVLAGHDIEDPYPTKPVLLCVEILSPDDRARAMLMKCEEYHAWGVPYCWVIDPVKQVAWEYHNGLDPVDHDRDGVLHAGEYSVSLPELFREAALG